MNIAYQLITCISQLEVWSRRRKFVDKLVDGAAKPCIFVTLKVGFQVFVREAFVNLWLSKRHKKQGTVLGES